jgi:hypothetical protein
LIVAFRTICPVPFAVTKWSNGFDAAGRMLVILCVFVSLASTDTVMLGHTKDDELLLDEELELLELLELDDELELLDEELLLLELDELEDELLLLELDELELLELLELDDELLLELDEELEELELLDEELLLELSGIRISMIIQISTIILISTSSPGPFSGFIPKSHLRKLIIASKKLSRHPLGSSVSSGLFPIPSCSLCSLPRRLTRI